MTAALPLIALLLGWGIHDGGDPAQPPGDQEIRGMLLVEEFKEERRVLIALGERAFATYLRILVAYATVPTAAVIPGTIS